jgi:nucleoside-diphosphate-sugar epimerase
MKKALVTGATGLLGRHLAETLAGKGWCVRALVRGHGRDEGLENLGVELVRGDLLDAESLKGAAGGVDYVFHSAAHVGDWGSRQLFFQTNVEGTRNLLSAAEGARVRKFVHISTAWVYGTNLNGSAIDESFPARLTGDVYGDSKVAAEKVVLDYGGKGVLPVTVLRPALCYGPHDWKFLPRVIESLRGKVPLMVGPGDHRAPLVFAGDVAECAVVAALSDQADGQVFNVASPERVTWNMIAETITGATGLKPSSLRVPFGVAYGASALMEAAWRLFRAAKPPVLTRYAARLVGQDFNFDGSRAGRQLGFTPRVRWSEGSALTLDWMRQVGLV